MAYENLTILIPAYKPDDKLNKLIDDLKMAGFRNIVVVDDGGGETFRPFFVKAASQGAVVLTHEKNRGKGAALKTAFREILARFPDACGTVTADADGQHRPDDVIRVAESLRAHPDRLTVGTRTFASGIPFRSRLGNLWTIAEFRLLTGVTVHDTQSGLRGIPTALLPRLLTLPGERYDYEIRALVACVRSGKPPCEVPIATIYENGNATSHYRPLADTFSTQRALFVGALTARCGS